MKISKREKVFISFTIVFSIIILYYNLFYKDLKGEINLLNDDIQKANRDLVQASDLDKQIKDLEADIENILEEVNIPLKDDSYRADPEIISFLENCINDLGLATRIVFDDSKKYDEYNECDVITINLNFESSYDGVRKILGKINSSPIPLFFESLSIDRKAFEPSNSSYNWEAEIILKFIAFPKGDPT